MSTRVRLWRLRRNPLRRRCDVLEAWIAMVLAALAAVGAPAAGLVASWSVDDSLRSQGHDRHPVSAVLVRDAPGRALVGDTDAVSSRARALVRWTAPDGTQRTGEAPVDSGLKAGAAATVWLDGRGRLTDQPLSAAQRQTQAWAVGAAVGGGSCVLLLAVRRAAGAALDRRRAAEWEHEWAVVGPQWSGSGPRA